MEQEQTQQRLARFDRYFEQYEGSYDVPAELLELGRSLYTELDDEQLRQVSLWSGYGFERLNPYLRNGRLPKSSDFYKVCTPAGIRKEVEIFDQTVRPMPSAMILYRGCEGHDRLLRSIWREPAFMSTSWKREIAESFAYRKDGVNLSELHRRKDRKQIERWTNKRPTLLEIEVPAGHPVIPVGATTEAISLEAEIVLARGSVLELIGRRKGPRGLTILRLKASHEGRVLSPASSSARRRQPLGLAA